MILNEKAYTRNKSPDYIDEVRQNLADKNVTKSILNADKEFVKFLGENYINIGTDGEIGFDKANRIVEALIGAVYVSKDFDASIRFTKQILEPHEQYHIIFPESDFNIWCRNYPTYYDEDNDFDSDEIISMVFDELESMKPDIVDALKWLKDKPLYHFHEVELWCSDKYPLLERAKLNICLLECDDITLNFYTNVCDNDPFFITLTECYLVELENKLGKKHSSNRDTIIWQEDPEMIVWYKSL